MQLLDAHAFNTRDAVECSQMCVNIYVLDDVSILGTCGLEADVDDLLELPGLKARILAIDVDEVLCRCCALSGLRYQVAGYAACMPMRCLGHAAQNS